METIKANGLQFGVLTRGDGDKLALCLHGFPDDAGSMVPLMERLAQDGYRCVAPYMRGYAPTTRPRNGNYQISALADDAVALVEALGHDQALLIGHDWGAVTAYAAAALRPDMFPNIVTMSVPPLSVVSVNARRDPRQLRRSWYIFFFQLPFLPERRLSADDFAMLGWLWEDWSPGWTPPPERVREVVATFKEKGTVRAALGYYRAGFRNSPLHLRAFRRTQALAATKIKGNGLVIAGEVDGCVGLALYHQPERAFEGTCRFEIIEGGGHWLPLQAPDQVAALIGEFLAA